MSNKTVLENIQEFSKDALEKSSETSDAREKIEYLANALIHINGLATGALLATEVAKVKGQGLGPR